MAKDKDILSSKDFKDGLRLFDQTNFTLAVDLFFKVKGRTKDPDTRLAIDFLIANCSLGLKNYRNALKIFLQLEQSPRVQSNEVKYLEYGSILSGLISCLCQLGQLAEAASIIKHNFGPGEVEKLRPLTQCDWYHVLGEYSQLTGDFIGAVQNFEKSKALAVGTKYVDVVISADIHLAQMKVVQGDYEAAKAILIKDANSRDASRFIMFYIETCVFLSKIYYHAGDHALADKYFNKIKGLMRHSDPMWLLETNREIDRCFNRPASYDKFASSIATLSREDDEALKAAKIVGSNAGFLKCIMLAKKVAQTDMPVLIQGETGSGKELVSRLVHGMSSRRDKPFVPVNCGAFTGTLLESELFGHKKGAFTGAVFEKKGLFEFVSGGTILLDECADMPLSMQMDLLRVIEERKIRRVGDNFLREIDARIILATNQDLWKLVQGGLFREDLYYRINMITIDIPPLRKRMDDLPILVDAFIKKHSAKGSRTVPSPKALEALSSYDWPGNVRELENEIKRIMYMFDTPPVIEAAMVFDNRPKRQAPPSAPIAVEGGIVTLEEMEKQYISKVLSLCDFNVSMAAKTLDVDRSGLIKKLKKYGITVKKALGTVE